MPTLTDRLKEYIAAAFTGLWIVSHEHDDALAEIGKLCRENQWQLATWNIDRGLRLPGSTNEGLESAEGSSISGGGDPLAALRALSGLAQPEDDQTSTILVMSNMHRFLGSAEVVQALAHQLVEGKQRRTFVVVLAPVVQLPLELEKLFVVLDHELPDREQMESIATGVATEEGELPAGDELGVLLDAAAGLTRLEAEGAFALSLVRHGRLTPESVWELKTQTLKKSGLLELHRGGERFDDLGGLNALKSFCLRALRRQDTACSHARPRGVMLLGVPGTGKSAFAKALGNETNRPTLTLDFGALMGSLVGQTEQNVRRALATIDAMAPCVAFVDEIEKGLSGVQSSGQTDSGVSARLFGSLLTWLNDHESDVFFIATCNDISKLPPEFSRAERFDGVFFLDLPSTAEKTVIWEMYEGMFGLPKQKRPVDKDWTGAEIRACCRLARLLDVSLIKSAQHVVPVAVTASESVQRLRQWADGRCLSTSDQGVYHCHHNSASGGRRVSRPAPTDN